jgi:beta-galactosidase
MAWEPILNETDYPEYFALEQIRCVKEECADGQCYYGCDDYSVCAELFPLHLRLGNKSGIPVFVREYGDSYTEQYGVATTTFRVRRGKNVSFYAGGEAPMLWSANKRFERYKKFIDDGNVCGGCVWVGIDHNRGYDLTECAGGILDFFRLKKYAYNMFESQQDIDKAGAKCFIASNWDKESSTDITVYTNAEKVRLLRNGEEMGVLDALGKAGLHPPVTFKNVEFIAGELVAEAIVNNEVVAKSVVRTHENATKLVLTPHFEGVNEWKADGADLLMVRVSAIDKNGVLDVSYEGEIEFFVEGDCFVKFSFSYECAKLFHFGG